MAMRYINDWRARGTNSLALLALCASAIGLASPAQADIIQIAAAAFAFRDSGAVGNAPYNDRGLLYQGDGEYVAPVVFSTNGQFVCRFSLIYRDNDADNNITARLHKKPFTLATNTAFGFTVVMAQVASSGATQNTRKATTTAITQPGLNLGQAFYFAEISIPDNAPVEVLGVQIDVRNTCP